jgi:exopolysaccharide biosynthesis polyprenyl glycosylphosphotransferase
MENAMITSERTRPTRTRGSARVSGRVPIGPLLFAADAVALGSASLLELRWAAAAVFCATSMVLLSARGGYERQFSVTLERSIPRLFSALASATVVTALLFDDATTLRLVRVLPWVLAATVLLRSIVCLVVRRINRSPSRGAPALLLGAGTTGVLLVEHLRLHPEYGIDPVGFIDRVDDDDLPLPVLGDVDDIDDILDRAGVRQLIIAFGQISEFELVGVIRHCQARDVDVWVIPRFFELGLRPHTRDAEEVWGIPLSRLPRLALRTNQWRVKRAFDVFASGAAIAALAPLCLALCLAVRLSSPGPIFFRQVRVGQRGRPFELLKFRTMYVNDDSSTTWSVAGDDRVTRIGRFLRRTCLDEIPQFLNVVRGDMSLVGPRPERPHFVEVFRDSVRHYDDRHRVPVGLTGLAQVNGLRGDTSITERSVFDNNYIENWSLWSDIVILFRTFAAVALRSPDRLDGAS